MSKIVVTGAGGFLGGHLAIQLAKDGHSVFGADIKKLDDWYQPNLQDMGIEVAAQMDLREKDACRFAVNKADEVYHLAADMGGMGYIESHKLSCSLSTLMDMHMLMEATDAGVGKFFYASSACCYPSHKQVDANVVALKESDAYPADPEDGYGWQKLYTERLLKHYGEETDLDVRIARYHNSYGPHGTWDGGREKAPAAICRKVIHAKKNGLDSIEVWGDGEQTRSFMFVDDCIEGSIRLMESSFSDPINIGTSEMVTINQLVDVVSDIAGVELRKDHKLDAPLGVRGRNSDNTLVKEVLGWEPSIPLRDGLEKTYDWIEKEMS